MTPRSLFYGPPRGLSTDPVLSRRASATLDYALRRAIVCVGVLLRRFSLQLPSLRLRLAFEHRVEITKSLIESVHRDAVSKGGADAVVAQNHASHTNAAFQLLRAWEVLKEAKGHPDLPPKMPVINDEMPAINEIVEGRADVRGETFQRVE